MSKTRTSEVPSSKDGVRLRSHGPTFSTNDLILNPDVLPHAKVGDTIRIWAPEDENKMLLLQVSDLSKVKGSVQLSVSQYIADLFMLPETVRCEVVTDRSAYRVEFVVMSVKGIYVGRGEMHKLTAMLQLKPLFLRQNITLSGLRVMVSSISSVRSPWTGIVDASTKVVFRSKSARFFLFVQVSREMEEFDSDGDLYFEKAINSFLDELFQRWNAGAYDHALSVVLFSRSFFPSDGQEPPPAGSRLHHNGERFVDYYREVVHMENRADWTTIIRDLKVAFSSFRKLIVTHGGRNSTAAEGNFLEAINLALNVFDKHYVDRDLRRNGQQIIVVTAGNGQFDVDPTLSQLTKHRLMDGIGCDVVCLKPRPLHAVPFFRQFHSDGRISFNIPSWFYVCYVRRRGLNQSGDGDDAWNVPIVCLNSAKKPLIPFDDPSQLATPDPLQEAFNLSECNPFSKARAILKKQTASKRRWINAFHRSATEDSVSSATTNPNYRGLLEGINWASITEPASLPLSTDYFPPENALKAKFTEHPYIMSLVPMENSYDDNPRLLMRELIYQRLVHGYQIVPSLSKIFTLEEASDKNGMLASVCYLSMAQDFQIISFDPSLSHYNVEVTIFHKNEENEMARAPVEYTYNLWGETIESPKFRSVKTSFSNNKMNYRLWNFLDRFIANQIGPSAFQLLKYWRIGYILFSTSAAQRKESTEKEIEWRRRTVESFNAFREFLETTKLPKGQPKREMQVAIPDVAMVVQGAPGEVTGARGKLDRGDMSALAKRMAVDQNLIRNMSVGLRSYREVMLGHDCIDFIFANVALDTRDEARDMALTLMDNGMLSMLRGSVDEIESALVKLVRLEPSKVVKKAVTDASQRKTDLNREGSASSGLATLHADVDTHNVGGSIEGISESVYSMGQNPTNADVIGGPAKQQNKIVIPMETSDRYEWLYVAHDPTYHPNRTFFLSVEWTSCTGSAVNDFVQLMNRKAKSCNLELIQIPLNFYQSADPFFSPVSLAFDVPALDDHECGMFQNALLMHFNFMLMQASSFEWVHVSGVAFVTVSKRSFVWYNNSLLIERDKAEHSIARELLSRLRTTVGRYRNALSGERVLSDQAELSALLELLPIAAARVKLDAILSGAMISAEEALSPRLLPSEDVALAASIPLPAVNVAALLSMPEDHK